MSTIRLAVFSIAFAIPALCAPAATHRATPAVVAYVFAHRAPLQPGQIDAHSLTRINYAFANIQDGRMVTGYPDDPGNLASLVALRKENPALTILISVGGWLWSGNFSDAVLTKESRERFVQSAMDFLILYHLDGLDIDWEYPGMPGAGHAFRGEDKRNFTLLVKELRARFDAETRKSGRRLYLTIAAGASDEFLAHTEMGKVQRYVDTVNLMSYDYYEPGSGPISGHHAPLFTNPADPTKVSGDASVRAFERAGVPASKLLLGIPFYGHVWGEVADREHGLYQPGKPIPNAFAPYSLIESTMLDHGYTRYWDPVASVPYLYNEDKHIFVTYEDAQSIAAKCNYVLTHRLGGVMFWDYSSDSSGRLLGAINSSLHLEAGPPAH
jgi:chitinase